MKKIIERNRCCGCHACFNICPKGAIIMEEDECGFKSPIIDKNKCINCGMCRKVCPVLNKQNKNKHKIESYAAYNKDISERMSSTSGGLFILLAKEIIKRKGVVFGAAFDKKFNVIHTYVEDEKGLNGFKGSKYTQSTIGDTYSKVKYFLEKGRYVLFSGTPCQIEGLKAYLMKDYEKLYTQDIICHGVPSPLAFRKYLNDKEKEYNDKINNISFRDKDVSWNNFKIKISFKNNVYKKGNTDDTYLRAFLNNISLRESCYNCSFKKKNRNSDITLADCWGIERINKEMFDNKGTSLVITNTNKGEELFNSIKKGLVYDKINLDEAIKYNSAMIKSVPYNINRDYFFKNLNNTNFNDLVNKCVPKPKIYIRFLAKIKNMLRKIYHMLFRR